MNGFELNLIAIGWILTLVVIIKTNGDKDEDYILQLNGIIDKEYTKDIILKDSEKYRKDIIKFITSNNITQDEYGIIDGMVDKIGLCRSLPLYSTLQHGLQMNYL